MRRVMSTAKHGFLFVFVLITLLPLYSVLINSVKLPSDIIRTPFRITVPTLENFKHVFNPQNDILRMYMNSITITGSSLVFILILAPMAGYYIARNKSRWSSFLLILFMTGIMIPDEVTIIPLVDMFVKMGLIGKLHGMILYYAGARLAVSIFLNMKFISTIPQELEESAVMDGASQFRIFWQVLYPLLLPCTATLIVFVGMNIWNDFLMPLYLLQGTGAARTITVGIFSAIGDYSGNWGEIFAWVVAASAPILILFLTAQRFFIDGLTAGAVKG
ncbi:carbohydrate ABC transporter permease [Paenibacillus cremeus]|uniref:Carbohydrate ABC transporter permease n=1 Tax=Paenibacillus cremeus TaxID=2163881 RepID=A0A559KAT7_9BACL|nr:carbohydrate ABC transporter permease [Paenibacillus cremeus]TVY09248.1 carbohydrate ABC transporter permease [Paenibacillus cremeus]